MSGGNTGRTAVLPPAGYRRPDRVSEAGLVIVAVSQGGEDLGTYDFRRSAGSEQLRLELAGAFARAAPPAGEWTSDTSCWTYFSFINAFLRFVQEHHPHVRAARDVTPAVWKAWTLSSSTAIRLRPVLLKVPDLPTQTRDVMKTRGKRQGVKAKVSSHSMEEFRAIRQVSQAKVREAVIRIREGRLLLERWRDGEFEPGTEGYLWGWALDHVAETAEAPRHGTAVRGGITWPLRRLVGGSTAGHHFWRRLFPTFEEMGAAAILLSCHDGWNFTTLAKMNVPDHHPNGEPEGEDAVIQRVATEKARRPRRLRHGSNNLVDLGDGTAGGAMRQVLFMTEQARETQAALGRPSDRLLVARRFAPVEGDYFGTGPRSLEQAVKDWSKAAAMRTADGEALSLSPQRIHRTLQVLYGGPRQNSSKVSDDTYRLRDEEARDEAATMVAKGLQAAVEDAVEKVRMRLVRLADTAENPAAQLGERTGLDQETAEQVLAGDLDTATGACTDYEHSPFTPEGPCSVSFLLCFACPNAIATERHLPRILYLQEAIESLRSVVSEAVWDADWAAHHDRIGDLINTYTREDERLALRAKLTAADQRLVDRMLERRLDI